MTVTGETFTLARTFDTPTLFRFSAVTWNAHRIHYDEEFALSQGLPGVVVQAHLHGATLAEAVLRWAGAGARLRTLEWRNTAPVTAGQSVTVHGTVTETERVDAELLATCDLVEVDDDGNITVRGSATVALRRSL